VLAIISRIKTNNPLTGLRWKILFAFLVIVGASFLIIAANLLNLVGYHLFEQRIGTDYLNVEKLSVQAAPLFSDRESQELQNVLQQAGGQLGGRFIIVDTDYKVQFDSFNQIIGRRLVLPEISGILDGGKSVDFGVHKLHDPEAAEQDRGLFSSLRSNDDGVAWVAYATAALTGLEGIEGVLLFLSPMQEMMVDLVNLQDRMLIYFIAAASAALIVAMVFSRVITKPIISLTRVIQRMGKGDLSARAQIKGSGEFKRLAITFNSMSERLEALDTSRNQFVANASHELKTPLATMKIMLESMIYQPDMEEALRNEFMTDMNNEIDRLNIIITDLLSLVQMDTNRTNLNRSDMDLAEVIRAVTRKLTPIARSKHQIILVNTPEPCPMYADSSKLTQVIYNLVDNAIKYTQPAGQITVTLSKTGRDALLTVKDNGPGIPLKDQSQVFDRFYRVDRARSRETGGTGLGLSIAAQIIQMHGGSIYFESDPDEGTAFHVELPIHRG